MNLRLIEFVSIPILLRVKLKCFAKPDCIGNHPIMHSPLYQGIFITVIKIFPFIEMLMI